MIETLKGDARGPSRMEIRVFARAAAAQYFGTQCVDVRISEPRMQMESHFRAEFEAREHHNLDRPTYGFARCIQCNKSLSTNDLPQARWEQ